MSLLHCTLCMNIAGYKCTLITCKIKFSTILTSFLYLVYAIRAVHLTCIHYMKCICFFAIYIIRLNCDGSIASMCQRPPRKKCDYLVTPYGVRWYEKAFSYQVLRNFFSWESISIYDLWLISHSCDCYLTHGLICLEMLSLMLIMWWLTVPYTFTYLISFWQMSYLAVMCLSM